MKLLVVSDIHANWPALRAILEAEPDTDRAVCLGDLVNYGPHPAECVAWAKEMGLRLKEATVRALCAGLRSGRGVSRGETELRTSV
jgi:hypothetical protein